MRAVLATTEEKSDQPLDNAVMGSACSSVSVGAARDDMPNAEPDEAGGGVGVLPKPVYRPPCEGGKVSDREALAFPSRSKYISLAVLWSGGLAVPDGWLEKDAGDPELLRKELPVAPRPDARDLRKPCADDGRPGGDRASAGGADGDHGLPARSASIYSTKCQYGNN